MSDCNLIPNHGRSPDELREMGRKGGIASGKARREKSRKRKAARVLLKELEKMNIPETRRLMDVFRSLCKK